MRPALSLLALSLPLLSLPLGLACKHKRADDSGGTGDGGGDTGPAAYAPDLHCPGDASCPDVDGALKVGVSKVVITPTCFEGWEDLDGNAEYDDHNESFLDCGCDRLCPGDAGYVAPDDGEGDGVFQAVWMAGFQNARSAQGINDDLWARAIVFDQGSTRVALVEVDLVGYFRTDLEVARGKVDALGLDVDHVIVAATHTHEGPDTMGLWGKTSSQSGVDPAYMESVNSAIAQAVQQAVGNLKQVGSMKVGSVDVGTYSDKGVYNVITDLRDPIVIDETMDGAAFWDTDGTIIASLAHFASHPESNADENLQLTSDFPYGLRQAMEDGTHWEAYDKAGLGGQAIFINGAVGGMMTGLRVDVTDPDGTTWQPYSLDRSHVMGQLLGEMALDAIDGGTPAESPTLSLAVKRFKYPVENWGFQALFLTGIIERQLYDYDSSKPIDDSNVPSIETELDVLQVGPIRFLTCPGELFPELNIGGYDGSHTGSADAWLVAPDNKNPPDLSQAPAAPYIKERAGGSRVWLVGLGNDELGYVVPEYDFQLDATNPWFDEAPGDHYEETNSLGPQTAGIYDSQVDLLVGWVDANQ